MLRTESGLSTSDHIRHGPGCVLTLDVRYGDTLKNLKV